MGSWNLGGASLHLLATSLKAIEDDCNVTLSIVGLQEVTRGSVGWTSSACGKWSVLSHQHSDDWRGTGLAYDSTVWAVVRKRFSTKGTWFRLRHVATSEEVWVGALYVAPHYNTVDMQGLVQEHLSQLPATTEQVYLCSDVNAAVKWVHRDAFVQPYGSDSKGRTLHDTLRAGDFVLVPPRDDQLHQSTSRPRQERNTGRAIDWIASRRGNCARVNIATDSCFEIGTDHDLLFTMATVRYDKTKKRVERITTGRRVVTSTPALPQQIDQHTLTRMAKTCTARPKGESYHDSPEIKSMFRKARMSKSPQDWKVALRARCEAHSKWRQSQIEQAALGDWRKWRQNKTNKSVGWEAHLAASLEPQDPHAAVHEHYSKIFGKGGDIPKLSRNPPRSPDITEEELKTALAQGKTGKSVGRDGVPLELLRKIVELPEGMRPCIVLV